MSSTVRKRQRPSARDFFDVAPLAHPEATEEGPCRVPMPSQAVPPQDPSVQNNIQSAPHEMRAELDGLEPAHRTSLLIRGGTSLSADEHARTKQVFVLRAADSRYGVPVRLADYINFHHIAKLLWGPGRREILHAQEIARGKLGVAGIQTDEMYMIIFVSTDAAYKAASSLAYFLNQFLVENECPLSVEAKVGSKRWWIGDGEPWTEAHWHGMRKSISRALPLPRPKIRIHQSVFQVPQTTYEVSQLPKWFTVELMINNLIEFKLPSLPIEMKFTEEATGEKPVRILVRFGDLTSSIISKFKLSMEGIQIKEEQVDRKAGQSLIMCLVDEGDSSIDNPWLIWTDAVIWAADRIKEYVVGIQQRHQETVEIKSDEDELDELQSDGTVQGDAESEDGAEAGGDNHLAPQQPLLGIVEQRKLRLAELERMIAQLSIECQAGFHDFQQRQRPDSAMYDAAEQAAYERKMARLTKYARKRKMLRRQTKKYRARKATPDSVKKLRKEWRRQQQRRNRERVDANAPTDESSEASSAEVESSESSEEENYANMTGDQWERSRRKRRCREIMHPRENESDQDSETHPKRIWMHDEVFRVKHARPNEPKPTEVD